jgi:molybdopterin/thiamine biosynthesis adenylyltransferase
MTTRATLVGAGGLGGPIAYALGAAGIELTIVDDDVVEISNLHRQIQFTASDIDRPKATTLAERLMQTGHEARGIVARWQRGARPEYDDADLVVDATDEPETKFAIADWAVANGRPYVIAAALRYGGNVMAGAPGAACYRCLFEEPSDGATCAEAGILGPVVAAIGGVAAALAIGLARGDRTNAGVLYVFDDLRTSTDPRIVRFAARRDCPACTRALISPFEATPVRLARP